MVTSSRKSKSVADNSYLSIVNRWEPGLTDRLRLLSWRRMSELGFKTYRDFSLASGISGPVIRRVFAFGGRKSVGRDLATRWIDALQLGQEDYLEVESWLTGKRLETEEQRLEEDEAKELFDIAVSEHETAEFNSDLRLAREFYGKAARDFVRVAEGLRSPRSQSQKLLKAEALRHLAAIEKLMNRADRAYWHAQEASQLADGLDGDIYLMAIREMALAYKELGRSGSREALRLLDKVHHLPRGLAALPFSLFREHDAGFWVRWTHRDAANILLRQHDRWAAREAIAAFRRAEPPWAEPLDAFLIRIAEARVMTAEGHATSSLRQLERLYETGMPANGGPVHFQTLLNALAEAQVSAGARVIRERDFVQEAIDWAAQSGLVHNMEKLLVLRGATVESLRSRRQRGPGAGDNTNETGQASNGS